MAADGENTAETPEATRQKNWMSELNRAVRWRKTYLDRCNAVLARYEDERAEGETTQGVSRNTHRYNIFWANVETIKPLCYTKVPPAQVLRRYPNDPDPIARIVAEVMERAINFSNDCYDFDAVLKQVRDQNLLLAEGTEWIRYVPQFEKLSTPSVDTVEPEKKKGLLAKAGDAIKNAIGIGDTQSEVNQEPEEKLVYEEVVSEFVNYQDWGTNKCRNWDEVRFVYRICYLNRAALVKRFGKDKGEKCSLNHKPPESDKTVPEEEREKFSQAVVYEVWDKPSKTAIWVSDGYPAGLLDEVDDPLELKHFWPFPRPAYGTLSPRALVAIPDFVQYQDLCSELDRHTERIGLLTKALRMVGIYAGEEKHTLQQIFDGKSTANAMIPVDDWAMWADKGGMKGVVEWAPIDKVATVLTELYKARELTIAAIYQICGIPDIMRGDTESEETAAAQNLKSTWGSSRMSEKQKEMARFCRDDYRIKGEIIAKKFSIKTIQAMTAYPLLTAAEKQAVHGHLDAVKAAEQLHQQRVQAAQAQMPPPVEGQPPAPPPQIPPPILPPPPFAPEKMALIDKPTWEEVDAYLKSDAMRQYRIDIEANSTVEPDMVAARRDAAEFSTAFGTLVEKSLPVVEKAPAFGQVVGAAARYLCSKYEMGREMEEVIEKAMTDIASQKPSGPDPELIKAQAAQQAAEQKANETAAKAQESQAKAAAEMARLQQEQRQSALDAREAELNRIAKERDDQWAARQTQMREQNDARKIDFEERAHDDEMEQRGLDRELEREKMDVERDKITSQESMETSRRDHEAKQKEADRAAKAAAEAPDTEEDDEVNREALAAIQSLAARQDDLTKKIEKLAEYATAETEIYIDPKTGKKRARKVLASQDSETA